MQCMQTIQPVSYTHLDVYKRQQLEHRAGKDAEGKTGDGVGIMLQISHKFFKKVTKPLGFDIGGEREYGVGMFFMPQDELKRNREMKMLSLIHISY